MRESLLIALLSEKLLWLNLWVTIHRTGLVGQQGSYVVKSPLYYCLAKIEEDSSSWHEIHLIFTALSL